VSRKHQDPEYRKNARIVRTQVAAARRAGREVACWRCGYEIDAEQAFDVGHIDPAGGSARSNLAPEHRYKTGRCQGNRAAGGRMGAARQQARAIASKGLLRW